MSKILESEENVKMRTGDLKSNDEKEENHSTDDCHSPDCQHNLKSKIIDYIGSFAQAPAFLQDNRFIHHGYRINYDSPKKIFKSLFILHNELVNIWSHFLGALLVIFFIIYIAFCLKPSIPSIKNEIQNDIQRIVSPIYEEIKNIENSLNEHTLEALKHIKEDISEYNKNLGKKFEDINENLKEKIGYIIHQLEDIKNTINKENVNYLCDNLQGYLKNYTSVLLEDLPSLLSKGNIAFSTISNYSSYLANGLDGIKSSVLEKIDSESYDWIELYLSFQELDQNHHHNKVSRWPIFIFLTSAILCLLFSAFFHLFYSMNKKMCNKMLCLDYAGISLLIFGSTFPPLVYSFFCQPHIYVIYESLIGVACLVVFIMSLFDTLHRPEYRKVKGILYGSLGIFAGGPILHVIIKEVFKDENDLDQYSAMRIVPYFLLMGVTYLSGLTIYVSQCPERFKPGKFDIWGSSHQLWHLMIVIAIVLTYFGSLEAYHGRIENKCPAF